MRPLAACWAPRWGAVTPPFGTASAAGEPLERLPLKRCWRPAQLAARVPWREPSPRMPAPLPPPAGATRARPPSAAARRAPARPPTPAPSPCSRTRPARGEFPVGARTWQAAVVAGEARRGRLTAARLPSPACSCAALPREVCDPLRETSHQMVFAFSVRAAGSGGQRAVHESSGASCRARLLNRPADRAACPACRAGPGRRAVDGPARLLLAAGSGPAGVQRRRGRCTGDKAGLGALAAATSARAARCKAHLCEPSSSSAGERRMTCRPPAPTPPCKQPPSGRWWPLLWARRRGWWRRGRSPA